MPAFTNKLINDLRDLPLWSCIIRDEFGYGRIPASNASVESEFNIIKNSFLKNEVLPMRVDEYVRKYVNYLNGRMKIVSAKIDQTFENKDKDGYNDKKTDDNSCNDSKTISNFEDSVTCPACINNEKPNGDHKCFICNIGVHNLDLCASPLDCNEGFGQKRICFKCHKHPDINVILASRHVENWGGETINTQAVRKNKLSNKKQNEKKQTAKYLGGNPYLIREQLEFHGKRKKIAILRNGSCDNIRPVKIDGKNVYTILTCAFDSLYQVAAAAVCDWPNFRARVNKKK